MKSIKDTFLYIVLAVVTAVMAACSSDDATGHAEEQATGKARVTLRLATDRESTVTRTWEDANAKTDRSEMMYQWMVLITDGSTIKYKYSGTPEEAKAEVDDVCTDVEMTAGTYTVYSFANISEASLKTLLGVTSLDVDATLTDAAVAAATATINGNGFDPTATNNYGSKGIPMSNRQTLTVPATGTLTKDLIVVRMLAKMTISVKNETGAEQYIKYATISNVTDNEANNLKLLPTLNYKDDMEAHHADIRPNLNGTPTTVELAIPNLATTEALANNATREVTFYINECKTGTDFNLTIGLGDATNTNEYRYALIDSKGATTADDDKWDYIARNDYRIIPIVLDDYHFEIIPYDFPPIGVYPVSVSEIDDVNHIYNFTFHDYGHFHLLPRVTKGSTTDVQYNVGSGDYWTLNEDWAGTWSTYDVKDGTAQPTGNYNLFYREETATADADDAGGIPVWYVNDGVAGPQWRPDVTKDYQPFIFGYIADPGSKPASDQKIYHEMKIKLYVGGTYRRDMIYRFYMTLSSDQMLYRAPGLAPAPRLPHWK